MCIKLRENIIEYLKEHPTRVRDVHRDALKELGDRFCEAHGLDIKRHHAQVVAVVIELYERRAGLLFVGGILQVPSAETIHRLGQHQKGVRKRHCRGNRRPRPTKLKLVRAEKSEPTLCSEEGVELLEIALGYAERASIRRLMDEQFADW